MKARAKKKPKIRALAESATGKAFEPGKVIAGRYEVMNLAYRGQSSSIYHCRHLGIEGMELAMKVLHFDDMVEDGPSLPAVLFHNEVLSSYAVNHQNVIKSYACVKEADFVAFTMEWVDGGSLGERIRCSAPLGANEICQTLGQACSALEAIHGASIIHGDLRPDNILLTEPGDLKIIDFGFANILARGSLRPKGGEIAPIEYLSPEYLLNGRVDERSDIYALGLIAYEMVTGRKPFDADNYVDALQLRLKSAPEGPSKVNSSCPRALNDIVLKAMARRPDERYQSALEMLVDVARFSLNRLPVGPVERSLRLLRRSEPNRRLKRSIEDMSAGELVALCGKAANQAA